MIEKNTYLTIIGLLVVFTIISCKTNTTPMISNTTVLVQLHDDNTLMALEDAYKDYSLKNERVVSRPMKIYLFNFDNTKITDTTLVVKLKKSELVKEAQRNNRVEIRNQP